MKNAVATGQNIGKSFWDIPCQPVKVLALRIENEGNTIFVNIVEASANSSSIL
ncbi:hypothetical protein [Flintibacter muris]|uniref:hypothetical protein n=1 Tax=Flintibacter muris TaxID=2941327 RepID=UPI0020417950|nr:hypothetical protein [Flintibacter muris]